MKTYSTLVDRVFVALVILNILFGTILIAINHLNFHFTTVLFFETHVTSLSWFQGVCIALLSTFFLLYGIYIRKISPRASTFIWGLGLFFWCLMANMILTNGIQATPFSPIDITLIKIDRWMGVNTPALMAWTHHHPVWHFVFRLAYNALPIELIGFLIILTLLSAKNELSVFYIAQLSTIFIGGMIYYFFPTIAPSGIFHSPYFSATQHDTSIRFYDVHHFITLPTDQGGLISFPSFHVVWAILLVNCCKAKKIIFYPVACFNVLLITSTVFLGWHYFVDVFSGIVLAVLGIVFANYVVRCDTYHAIA